MSNRNTRKEKPSGSVTGRRFAVLSAVVLLGVTLAVALLHLEDLTVAYHLFRLRHSSDYILRLLNQPEDSPGQGAIRAFLETAEGQECLVGLWVDLALTRTRKADLRPPDHKAYSVIFGLTKAGEAPEALAVRVLFHEPPRSTETTASCAHTVIPTVHALLPAISTDREWSLPAYPDLRFRVSGPGDGYFNFQTGRVVVGKPSPKVIAEVVWRPDRLAAAKTLTDVGAAGAPGLIKLLADDDAAVRLAAADGLHALSAALDETDDATRALLGHLADAQVSVRRAAARALIGVLRPEFPADLSPLVSALDDEDPLVRARAAAALGNSRRADREVTGALARALEDSDPQVRFRAAQSLGDLGPGATSARNALRNVLKDQDGLVRYHAERALRRLAVP